MNIHASELGEPFYTSIPEPLCYWWLSFCDPDKPKGTQFLGVAIVVAQNFGAAVLTAGLAGCNPGGEVEGYLFNSDACPVDVEPYLNRLMSKTELEEAGLV